MRSALLELFHSSHQTFVKRTSIADAPDENGKRKATYVTVKGAPTARDAERHLAGEVALVLKPDLADGTCTWAMLDFDLYLDKSALVGVLEKVDALKLPLHTFESKSGGLHCAAFFSKPIPVETARALLENWKAQLGYAGNPQVEVFPKPVIAGKIPYGIAIP